MSVLVLVALGLLAGFAGGMLGIGGGAIMVPVLVFLGFKVHVAIGTSLAVIVPLALAGALAHYGMVNVDVKAACIMASGAVVGAVVGAKVAKMLPSVMLEKVFAVALLVLAIWMLLK